MRFSSRHFFSGSSVPRQLWAAGSRRIDDNEETLKKRFVKHNKHTIPVVEYFRTKGLVREIDTNRSIQDVFADVAMVIDEILK